MKADDQDHLLNDCLGGQDLETFRQASLNRALPVLRQKRRRRVVIRTAAAAVIPLVAMVFAFWPGSQTNVNPENSGAPMAAAQPVSRQPHSNSVQYISDDELFALFPERSVALVGRPGKQRLVFLDQNKASRPATSL